MGANTNAPCLMIGEKGAELVIKDWGKGKHPITKAKEKQEL